LGAEFIGFWISRDSLEQILVGNGEFLLINSKTRESTGIGNTIDEARNKLKELGKAENFSDFIND
jgi:hypothetical protein